MTAEPKTFYFDLSKHVDKDLKHKIDFILTINFN